MKCHFFFQIKQFQYTLNNKFSITMQASNNTILQSTNKDSIFGLPCVYFIHHVIYIYIYQEFHLFSTLNKKNLTIHMAMQGNNIKQAHTLLGRR